MTRFIKRTGMSLFWTEEGEWTQERSKAQKFKIVTDVLHVCETQNLQEVELLIQVGPEPSPEYDIRLPLR